MRFFQGLSSKTRKWGRFPLGHPPRRWCFPPFQRLRAGGAFPRFQSRGPIEATSQTGTILVFLAAFLVGAGRCAGQEEIVFPEMMAAPPSDWFAEPLDPSPPARSLEEKAHAIWPALAHFPERVAEFVATPPPPRFMGYGYPLSGTSWRNRPWYTGAFFGALVGDDLIDGRIEQDVGLIGGWRFGYNLGDYWGAETRIAYASATIDDGVSPPPARDVQEWFFDGDLLLYPWGDAQWRPYLSLGAGAAAFRFEDEDGIAYRESLFQIPVGVGVKYLYDRWFAFRADLTHHVVIGAGGLDTMDHFSATAGFEIHFGGRPRSYFPW